MSIFTSIKRHLVLATGIVAVVVIIGIIAGRAASRTDTAGGTGATTTPRVTLVDAASFKNTRSTISADGIVESVSQVDLKSQLSAPLAAVNVSIGSHVSAGQVIAELQNADIRAQLDQARATLALAQGQYYTSGVSVESARRSALDKIRDSYVAADEVVHGELDQFLYTSQTGNPSLSSYITDSALSESIRTSYIILGTSFKPWKQMVDNLSATSSDSAIQAALDTSRQNLAIVTDLLNDISAVLNDIGKNTSSGLTDTFDDWRDTVTAARASISGAVTGLTTVESALSGAQASKNSPAEAQISVAQAGVKNLEAQLAKTVIASPISGTIAALPLRSGELASPGALIATVVGSGGLQVKAYASGEDLPRLSKGASAVIGNAANGISGTVASVAPSVNQENKKVEIKILVSDPSRSGLVIGQNVPVTIAASTSTAASLPGGAPVESSASNTYVLPIQDVKIIPGDAFVYIVNADSKIESRRVLLGEVRGDFVEIKSGLSDDMQIVSPVYGLNEGDAVQVQ